MAANKKVTDFWDVAPCSLEVIDSHFKGAYCPRYQAIKTTFQETATISVLHIQNYTVQILLPSFVIIPRLFNHADSTISVIYRK